MRLSDATVVIRPRITWEAMDLGVLMSQRHRRLLMTSWAIVTLPTFAVLSLLLWDSPSLAVFIFWWLKPAFERLPLYILSKTLFGETLSGDDRSDRDLRLVYGAGLDRLLADRGLRARLGREIASDQIEQHLDQPAR